jgi:hypothetical protein
MNRRDMVKLAALQAAVVAFPETRRASAQGNGRNAASPSVILRNAYFELTLTPADELQCKLVHLPTGAVIADGAYSYSFGSPRYSPARKDDSSIVLEGGLDTGPQVRHRFSIDPSGSFVEEQIEIHNTGPNPVDLHDARAGFVLPLAVENGHVAGPLADYKFTAIPFRREPSGSKLQYADFSLHQVLCSQYSSELWSSETTVTSAFASEGWAFTDGKHGFVISKYSPGGLEFSLVDRVTLPEGKLALRWGGAGIYRCNPEHGAWLKAGETHRFGVSRITAYKGDWTDGFYTFRREMAQRGHGVPDGFDPPVHWNELYDNKLWWLPGDEQNNPEMRRKYYTLASMREEAAKAKEIGCQALYMDPGWDTSFASKVWDEARLGSYSAFTQMLHNDYGLKSSLHTPLSGWCDPSSYPEEARRLDRFGQRAVWDKSMGFSNPVLCGASKQYLNETLKRLNSLADDGATFFMFDGTAYHEECWDPNHGHQVPSRLEEHCQATCRLARMVHLKHPEVLIEMHDPALGGAPVRAVPIYYGYAHCPEGEEACQALGFDTVWAFELMWRPMEDLTSGRSVALYYYNLAYSLPLYIHIDLRTDNANAIVFWWNASTCRHLGIGGTHPDPAVREAQKKAMSDYRRLKTYFSQSDFFGIDEQTHVHTDRSGKSAVINCFNFEQRTVEREVRIDPSKVGLSADGQYKFSGGSFQASSGAYVGKVSVPALGHILIEIT